MFFFILMSNKHNVTIFYSITLILLHSIYLQISFIKKCKKTLSDLSVHTCVLAIVFYLNSL